MEELNYFFARGQTAAKYWVLRIGTNLPEKDTDTRATGHHLGSRSEFCPLALARGGVQVHKGEKKTPQVEN